MSSVASLRCSKVSVATAPIASMVRCCCDMTLPLTSTSTGRGGSRVSGGDTANVNEIMAPAAAITPLDASSCIACMARIVCPIRGIGKTKCDLYGTISGTMVPPSPRLPGPYGVGRGCATTATTIEQTRTGSRTNRAPLEFFGPRPHFHFPRPSATRLAQHVPIVGGDRIRSEHRVWFVCRLGPPCAANAAVDHEMRDVDALRRQFAGQALCKAAQCKLAHRKRC